MFDCLITLFSLLAVAWFVLIEPAIRRWREYQRSQRSQRENRDMPEPRYPPPVGNEEKQFESLIEQLAYFSREPVHEPGTGTVSVPAIPTVPSDTNGQNGEYQRVQDLVRRGYSGNQIVGIIGGKRADVLALVRQARKWGCDNATIR